MRSRVWNSLNISVTIVSAVTLLHYPTKPLTWFIFPCLCSPFLHGVGFSVEINSLLSHSLTGLRCDFSHLCTGSEHLFPAKGLLRTLRSNLCCRCGHRVCGNSDQWISGGREGLLRELMLGWLVGVNRWMDRLLEEWAAQRMAALFIKWCRKYIIEWPINFTSIIFSLEFDHI